MVEQEPHDQRRDGGTGIETRIDEAEDPAPGIGRRGLAHQHVARRKGQADQDAGEREGDSQNRGREEAEADGDEERGCRREARADDELMP